MEFKVAAIVAYLPVLFISVVMSVVYLRTEPKTNYFLRFHAMQSLFVSGAYFVIWLAAWLVSNTIGLIPFINVIVMMIAGPVLGLASAAYFLGSIFLMIKAQSGEEYKLPMFGDYAEQYLAKIDS
jgi:uncharacterized membrane protein